MYSMHSSYALSERIADIYNQEALTLCRRGKNHLPRLPILTNRNIATPPSLQVTHLIQCRCLLTILFEKLPFL